MVLHKSDIYGGYDGFQSTIACCTQISVAEQPSCPAFVLLPVCARVLYVIQKLRAFISLTHQYFFLFTHTSLFPLCERKWPCFAGCSRLQEERERGREREWREKGEGACRLITRSTTDG